MEEHEIRDAEKSIHRWYNILRSAYIIISIAVFTLVVKAFRDPSSSVLEFNYLTMLCGVLIVFGNPSMLIYNKSKQIIDSLKDKLEQSKTR